MDNNIKYNKIREFIPEEQEKLKRSQNIVLIVLVVFVLMNIGIFMWFMMSQAP